MQFARLEPRAPVVANKAVRVSVGLAAALVCIGFSAVIAQVLLLRELMVISSGNEIALGLMLAVWLLWTALGGWWLGRWRLSAAPRTLVAVLEAAIAVILPATIVAVRASRSAFHATPGELLGPGAVLAAAAATLSVFCALSGWLFAAATRAYEQEAEATTAVASGTVYLLEALGSGAGGLAASVVLLRWCSALQIALLVGLANLICALGLVLRRGGKRWIAQAAACALMLGLLIWVAPPLERASLGQLWRGFRLVTWQDSVYGHLDVVEEEGNRSIYQSGLFLAQAEDAASAEEAVHFALLEHPAPRSLLLIGGGINGSLAEALKHASLARIDYVELDPSILGLAGRYFSGQASALGSNRVGIHTLDGRLFVKTTGARFDVIIVNLPDPQTAQLNRFYTREFFAEAASRLNPGGVLSLQLRGAENYISPELGELLRCLQRTLESEFAEVAAIPGETIHFSASNQRGTLTTDPETLLARLRERRVQTRYVSEYYIPFRMAPDRMRELEQQLRSRPDTRINEDLSPLAYYFGVTLWSAHFGGWYREVFVWLAKVRFSSLLLATLLPLLALAAGLRWKAGRNRSRRASAAFCTGGMGFTLMALELLLLLGFQAIYGYVYQQLAIIIAGFMAGMALGSWLKLRPRPGSPPESNWTLAALQATAALSPLAVYGGLRMLEGLTSSQGLLLAGQMWFPAVAIACGLLGGYQFQVASRVYFGERSQEKASPAALYAIDLVGACLGAILLSVYLAPVFGLLKTACLIAAANLAPTLAALPAPESRRA